MIFAKYEIQDIFHGTQMIETGDHITDEKYIKIAFKAMLKYNACIWVDGMRYLVHGYKYFEKNTPDNTVLEKTPYNDIFNYGETVFNYGETVLIDYNTALKQELKKLK